MLPLNPTTVLHLALIGVALSAALAMQCGRRWRIIFVFPIFALPAAFLWSETPAGQYAGLGYVLVLGSAALALSIGIVFGEVLRFAAIGPVFSLAATFLVAAFAAGVKLHQQYVPKICPGSTIQVRIAGKTLHIPPEMMPRLEKNDSIGFFGRTDRKSDFARFCRISQNGTRPIEVDRVWLTPASSSNAMTAACTGNEPPNWCRNYSPKPYQFIGKVLIAPEGEPGFPLPYWKDGGYLKKSRQGDLNSGSVCLLPDTGTRRTQCWDWQPFGDGSRLIVSTNNLDPAYDEMPIDAARAMIRQAREMTLSIMDK